VGQSSRNWNMQIATSYSHVHPLTLGPLPPETAQNVPAAVPIWLTAGEFYRKPPPIPLTLPAAVRAKAPPEFEPESRAIMAEVAKHTANLDSHSHQVYLKRHDQLRDDFGAAKARGILAGRAPSSAGYRFELS
jgi:hypothetical protein